MPNLRLFTASTKADNTLFDSSRQRCEYWNRQGILLASLCPLRLETARLAGQVLLALILSLLTPLSVSGAENLDAAAQKIDQLHSALLGAMKLSGKNNYENRLQQLTPVVESSFAFETVSRAVLGRNWRQLDDAQKSEFIKVFSALSSSTYASQFSSYDGESFSKANASAYRDTDAKVNAELIRSGQENVKFTYLLRDFDGEWRIVNVIAQGVSDIALKRADYSSVIKSEGFEALLEKIRAQVTN